MWSNMQETADLVTFTEESPKENFIFVQWFLYRDERILWKIMMTYIVLPLELEIQKQSDCEN